MGGGVIFGLLLTLCVVTIVKGRDTCCPDGWLPYSGSCYLFHDEERLDWTEATTYCRQKNAELAATETENESLFLEYFARRLYKKGSEGRNGTLFWLGATDRDIEGIWKWYAKDEVLTYSAWNEGPRKLHTEPDNHNDCLGMMGLYNFVWNDVPCSVRIGYPLCEKPGSGDSGMTQMQIIG